MRTTAAPHPTRRPITAALVAAAALLLAACAGGGDIEVIGTGPTRVPGTGSGGGSGGPDTTTRGSSTTRQAARQDLTVDAGFTAGVTAGGNRWATVGALITNPNPDLAAYEVSAVFNLLDANGTILDTDTVRLEYVPAGATVPVAPLILGFEIPEPAALEVDLTGRLEPDEGWDGAEYTGRQGIELVVSDPRFVAEPYSLQLVFTATNPSTTEVAEYGTWDCVFRNGGVVVGGEASSTADPIVPGGSVRASSYLDFESLAVDEIICRAYA